MRSLVFAVEVPSRRFDQVLTNLAEELPVGHHHEKGKSENGDDEREVAFCFDNR